eukprot:scaffold469447_cov21-Prasinocladus_malaysianus.AAC.1
MNDWLLGWTDGWKEYMHVIYYQRQTASQANTGNTAAIKKKAQARRQSRTTVEVHSVNVCQHGLLILRKKVEGTGPYVKPAKHKK